jgi:hypothetical protein
LLRGVRGDLKVQRYSQPLLKHPLRRRRHEIFNKLH